MTHIRPSHGESSFNCPLCGVYAVQIWYKAVIACRNESPGMSHDWERIPSLSSSQCVRCRRHLLWEGDEIIYPTISTCPAPAPDMPDNVKLDFEEARAVFGTSPRSSAALLRLALQKLCKHLGESGKNINDDIASLVKKGLSPELQKALDVLRVVGNNAVHPGELNVNDDPSTASKLFVLINVVVERLISHPKQVASMFDGLPEGALQQIAKRDGSA